MEQPTFRPALRLEHHPQWSCDVRSGHEGHLRTAHSRQLQRHQHEATVCVLYRVLCRVSVPTVVPNQYTLLCNIQWVSDAATRFELLLSSAPLGKKGSLSVGLSPDVDAHLICNWSSTQSHHQHWHGTQPVGRTVWHTVYVHH